MTRKLPVILVAIILLSLAPLVSAENATSGNPQRVGSPAAKVLQEENKIKTQNKAELTQVRINLRDQIRDAVEAKKLVLKEKIASKEAEFKQKLQLIKDTKKKALIEKINEKINTINARHTERYAQIIGNLQLVFDKTETTMNKTSALGAINAAKLAVENQASKTYTITIATEEGLRNSVGLVISQLRQDLNVAYKAVVNARQAVMLLYGNNTIINIDATPSAGI
jgi:hypothetical protein